MAKKMRFALLISAAILGIELVAGFLSNSLALLSDAGHVFTDMLALSLSWYAVKQAEKPATAGMTFGYHRIGILAAMINALSLTGTSAAVFYEAAHRWRDPEPVHSVLMLSTAIVGLLANLLVVSWLRHDAESNLNVRAAWWHALGDSLSSVGVIVAAVIIMLTGSYLADPLVSIVIGTIIIGGAWGIAREGVRILLEASPAHIDSQEVFKSIKETKGVKGVHDLHIWSIAPGINALSCHLLVDNVAISEGNRIIEDVSHVLADKFGIGHSTLQLECDECCDAGMFCTLVAQGVKHPHGHAH